MLRPSADAPCDHIARRIGVRIHGIPEERQTGLPRGAIYCCSQKCILVEHLLLHRWASTAMLFSRTSPCAAPKLLVSKSCQLSTGTTRLSSGCLRPHCRRVYRCSHGRRGPLGRVDNPAIQILAFDVAAWVTFTSILVKAEFQPGPIRTATARRNAKIRVMVTRSLF